jgi:hypothetical protein
MADEFVRIENHVAFAGGNGDRDDLFLESAGFLRGFRFLLGGGGEFVLFLARDVPFLCDVLGRYAHVVVVIDIPQPVDDHRVDELAIHHTQAVAGTVQRMRGQAHALLSARDHDFRIAGLDRLRGKMGGFQPGTTDFVDGHCRDHVGKAGADGGLARRVLTGGAGENLAHQHLADSVRFYSGSGEQRGNHFGAELRCGNFAYRAAELADTRAQCSDDYHVIHLRISSLGNVWNGSAAGECLEHSLKVAERRAQCTPGFCGLSRKMLPCGKRFFVRQNSMVVANEPDDLAAWP